MTVTHERDGVNNDRIMALLILPERFKHRCAGGDVKGPPVSIGVFRRGGVASSRPMKVKRSGAGGAPEVSVVAETRFLLLSTTSRRIGITHAGGRVENTRVIPLRPPMGVSPWWRPQPAPVAPTAKSTDARCEGERTVRSNMEREDSTGCRATHRLWARARVLPAGPAAPGSSSVSAAYASACTSALRPRTRSSS